jgi:tight adherence protein C
MGFAELSICVATFLGVTSLRWALLSHFSRDDRQIDDRISGLAAQQSEARAPMRRSNSKQLKDSKSAAPRARLASRLLMHDQEERHRLQKRLLNAGIYAPSALPIYLAVKLLLISGPPVAGTMAGVCGWVTPHSGLLIGSTIGILGLVLPRLWLQAQKRRWHNTINRSLPDFLDLMVTCLEAGLSAEAALQRVTTELQLAHPRLSAELGVVQSQIELGATSEAALKNFADRSDHEAIRAIATVVQQARRLGGGIAEAFRQQAETLRMRREHFAEEKAQQAAVKILLPTLLLIFPSIFVVLAGPAVIQLAEKFGGPVSQSSVTSERY